MQIHTYSQNSYELLAVGANCKRQGDALSHRAVSLISPRSVWNLLTTRSRAFSLQAVEFTDSSLDDVGKMSLRTEVIACPRQGQTYQRGQGQTQCLVLEIGE